jgi:hypothetical protein
MRPDASPIALALTLPLALLAAPGSPADEPHSMPETSAEIVEIDVVVRDSNGVLVRDLQESDFEVLEDGKKQTISHFSRAVHKKAGPDA